MQSLQAFKGSVGYDAIEKTAKNELYNNKNFILVRPTNLWSLQIHIKVIYLKGNIIFWSIGYFKNLHSKNYVQLNFIYSEKATKFCEIFPLLLTVRTVIKSKGKISQNFAAFSEYMNFTNQIS